MSNYLFVKPEEWEEYELKTNCSNKIHKFWKQIIEKMPVHLQKELKMKSTNLLKFKNKNNEITGALPFKFYTKEGSEELQNYLQQFIVFIENDSKEILDWKEKIHKALIRKI